MREDGQ
jgi:hypothetical protein